MLCVVHIYKAEEVEDPDNFLMEIYCTIYVYYRKQHFIPYIVHLYREQESESQLTSNYQYSALV